MVLNKRICGEVEPGQLAKEYRNLVIHYTPPGRDLYCSPCRLYGVIWITSWGGYGNFEFLKITAPIVFNQRFEQGTLGSESQCSSTAPSWDLYVKSGDNVVNAEGRANEIGQSWCPADLLNFQLPTTGTSQRPSIDSMQTHVA